MFITYLVTKRLLRGYLWHLDMFWGSFMAMLSFTHLAKHLHMANLALVPKWDTICEFMRKKFDFSTQGHAILFAYTTILISPDQALEFFATRLTPSPFLLVATSLIFLVASSTTNLSLFIVDHTHKNP